MGNTSGDAERNGGGSVQSVDRALTILEVLAAQGASGVTEIAAHLGVHKSTAFRLISVLEDHRLVEQVADRGKYKLGFGLIRLAGATSAQLELTREAQPVCERLADDLRETVNVAVLRDFWVVNLSQVRGPAAVSTYNWVGQPTPPHATSSGKVLLAYGPAGELDDFLARPRTGYTPRTLTSAADLRKDLAAVAGHGYGATVEELEAGLNAVAAPVRDLDGAVVAAVSVSGPSYRLGEDRIPEVGAAVVAAADEISRRLGWSSS